MRFPQNGPGSRCMALRWGFRVSALGLAAARIFAGRNTIGPDPRSYLELARAILRHDWPMTINGHWSALYPWLLAPWLSVLHPSLRWEFPVAHAFAIPTYLLCIAAFELFWTALLQTRSEIPAGGAFPRPPISAPQMWVLGYSLFIWLTIGELILLINPDICVTAIALIAAALLLRMENRAQAGPGLYAGLGACLGLGYLAKAFLFPMGFIFLAAMVWVSRHSLRRRAASLALAAVMFGAIAFPQIAALSRAKGRFTFSDSGKLSIAWLTYGVPYRNWQGQPPGSGTPAHPTRKLYEHPAVYEFNGPLRSSYPPWYDPSYWNEGLSPKLSLGATVKHAAHEMLNLSSDLVHPTAWLGGMLLILVGCDRHRSWKALGLYFPLIFISTVAFGLYSITLVESRYLVPWEILLWGSVLAAVRLRGLEVLYRWISAGVCAALMASMIFLAYRGLTTKFRSDASPEYATAEGLLRMGIRPAAKVAAIGFDNDAYWAYLARLNIVAEINTDETCLFWNESPETQARVLNKFRDAGAVAVVANTGGGVRTTSRAAPFDLAGCAGADERWKIIDGSPNHAFLLK